MKKHSADPTSHSDCGRRPVARFVKIGCAGFRDRSVHLPAREAPDAPRAPMDIDPKQLQKVQEFRKNEVFIGIQGGGNLRHIHGHR